MDASTQTPIIPKNSMPYGIRAISADSHIAEPPNAYTDYVDPDFRKDAPFLERQEDGTDRFIVPGMGVKLNVCRVAGAGKTPQELARQHGRFDELRPGSWDPKVRMADQDVDGIGGEMIYPTIGMLLCGHPDREYQTKCYKGYNRWLAEFCGAQPKRLFGIGQTAVTSPEAAVKDLHEIKRLGHWGAMLPLFPGTEEDYSDPSYDRLWAAAVELEMPLSFHIIAGGQKYSEMKVRGPQLAAFNQGIWSIQEVASMFVLAGVFERFPKLKIVLAEADAGWAPHYMSRMDRAYQMHRFLLKCDEMPRLPSEYFYDHIYMTYQDDPMAFKTATLGNPRQLLWANDYPHSDSTWPRSQEMLRAQTEGLAAEHVHRILRGNVVDLYKLPVAVTE